MEKITVFTKAYNSGKLIHRCIKSVLNQTMKDFIFVIIDNASQDGTKEVLEDYAQKDGRIHLYRNEENNITALQVLERYIDTEYFIMIDHDDWFEPEAFEVMLNCALKEKVDMVFGCTNMYTEEHGIIDTWGINRLTILTKEEISNVFPRIYWQLRTFWNVLIRKDLIQFLDKENVIDIKKGGGYAVDTAMTLSLAFSSKKIAFLPNITHNYLIHGNSESHKFRRNQFYSNWRIYDIAVEYLKKYGEVSENNLIYLSRVYGTAICDTLQNAIDSKVERNVLSEVCYEILEDSHTEIMISYFIYFTQEEKTRFLKQFGQVVSECSIYGLENQEDFVLTERWIKLIYGDIPLTKSDLLVILKEDLTLYRRICVGELYEVSREEWKKIISNACSVPFALFILMKQYKEVKRFAGELLNYMNSCNDDISDEIEEVVEKLAMQNLLLKTYDKKFLKENQECVLMICAEEYENALVYCIEKHEKSESNDIDLLKLVLNLSAVIGDATVFLSAKKVLFLEYYNKGMVDAAKKEFTDLYEIDANDADVIAWKKITQW